MRDSQPMARLPVGDQRLIRGAIAGVARQPASSVWGTWLTRNWAAEPCSDRESLASRARRIDGFARWSVEWSAV